MMRSGKHSSRRAFGIFAVINFIFLAAIILWPVREAASTTRQGYWYAREVDDATAALDGLGVQALTYAGDLQQFYAILQAPAGQDGLQLAALSAEFKLLRTWRVPGAQLTRPMMLYNETDGRIYLLEGRGNDCCDVYSLAPGQASLRVEGQAPVGALPGAAAFDEQGALQVLQDGERLATVVLPSGGSEQQALADEEAAITDGDLGGASMVVVQDLRVRVIGARANGAMPDVTSDEPVRQLSSLLDDSLHAHNAVTAPSLDSTDAAQTLSVYVVGAQSVVEIAYQPPPSAAPLDDVLVSLSSSTSTWEWTPPSPDPAGITYLAGRGQLLISDSEVNEHLHQDGNLFLASLDGSLQATDDTLEFSREPTGVTVNPANGHIFISDDDQHQFYHLNGLPGSGDLLRTVNTEPAGSSDPEGIAYDAGSGHVFVVDGVDSEVYRFTPTGDYVGSFDVSGMGVSDPEGIAYDTVTDHLLVLDSTDGQIVEVTRAGQWVRDIQLSAPDLDKPAGLVYGPVGGGATTQTLYVVDRQVDNGSDSQENDGLLFEFQVPLDEHETATPTETAAPSDTPTATSTSTPVPIDTATPTNTPEPTDTSTSTPETPGATPLPTETPEPTATASPTETLGPTSTPTKTPQPPATPDTPTATYTPVGPTGTPPAPPTDTPTATSEPSPTPTPEGTAQPTPTVSPGSRYRNYFPVLTYQRFGPWGEENDSCAAGYPLLSDTLYRFLPEDRDDWYRFTTVENAEITVRLADFAPLLGQIAAYRGPTCGTATFLANNGNNSAEKVLQLGVQPPGTFYVYVSNDGPLNNASLYSLIVQTR